MVHGLNAVLLFGPKSVADIAAAALQAFGMMGWRLGYIAYPNAGLASDPSLGFQMSKVQDTIPICVTQMSQVAGVGALAAGSPWVRQQVQGLSSNRSAMHQLTGVQLCVQLCV